MAEEGRYGVVSEGKPSMEATENRDFAASQVELPSSRNKKRRVRMLKLDSDDDEEDEFDLRIPQQAAGVNLQVGQLTEGKSVDGRNFSERNDSGPNCGEGKSVDGRNFSERNDSGPNCASEVVKSQDEARRKSDCGIASNKPIAPGRVRILSRGNPGLKFSSKSLIGPDADEFNGLHSDDDGSRFDLERKKRRRLSDGAPERTGRSNGGLAMKPRGESRSIGGEFPSLETSKSVRRMPAAPAVGFTEQGREFSRYVDGKLGEDDRRVRFEKKRLGESQKRRGAGSVAVSSKRNMGLKGNASGGSVIDSSMQNGGLRSNASEASVVESSKQDARFRRNAAALSVNESSKWNAGLKRQAGRVSVIESPKQNAGLKRNAAGISVVETPRQNAGLKRSAVGISGIESSKQNAVLKRSAVGSVPEIDLRSRVWKKKSGQSDRRIMVASTVECSKKNGGSSYNEPGDVEVDSQYRLQSKKSDQTGRRVVMPSIHETSKQDAVLGHYSGHDFDDINTKSRFQETLGQTEQKMMTGPILGSSKHNSFLSHNAVRNSAHIRRAGGIFHKRKSEQIDEKMMSGSSMESLKSGSAVRSNAPSKLTENDDQSRLKKMKSVQIDEKMMTGFAIKSSKPVTVVRSNAPAKLAENHDQTRFKKKQPRQIEEKMITVSAIESSKPGFLVRSNAPSKLAENDDQSRFEKEEPRQIDEKMMPGTGQIDEKMITVSVVEYSKPDTVVISNATSKLVKNDDQSRFEEEPRQTDEKMMPRTGQIDEKAITVSTLEASKPGTIVRSDAPSKLVENDDHSRFEEEENRQTDEKMITVSAIEYSKPGTVVRSNTPSKMAENDDQSRFEKELSQTDEKMMPGTGLIDEKMITGSSIESSKPGSVLRFNAPSKLEECDDQSRSKKEPRQIDEKLITGSAIEASKPGTVVRSNAPSKLAENDDQSRFEKMKPTQEVAASVPGRHEYRTYVRRHSDQKRLDKGVLEAKPKKKSMVTGYRAESLTPLPKEVKFADHLSPVPKEGKIAKNLSPLPKEGKAAKSLSPLPKEGKTAKSLTRLRKEGKTAKSPTRLPKETRTAKKKSVSEQRKGLRERLRDGLLAAGWSIDLRPRKGRNYLDSVYISPSGASFWSLPKAWQALKQSLGSNIGKEEGCSNSLQATNERGLLENFSDSVSDSEDALKPVHRGSGKDVFSAAGEPNSLMTMVCEEDISLLKRKRRNKGDISGENHKEFKKEEKDANKEGKNGLLFPAEKAGGGKKKMKLSRIDGMVPKGRARKKTSTNGKLVQRPKVTESQHQVGEHKGYPKGVSVVQKVNLESIDTQLHSTKKLHTEIERKQKIADVKASTVGKSIDKRGKRNKNRRGNCGLLVRSSRKGDEHYAGDERLSSAVKRTVLSWLIDVGAFPENECVQYWNRKGTRVIMEGWVTRDGILCECCNKVFSVSNFQVHANGKLHRPFENIFLQSGKSLMQCQMEAWAAQDESKKVGKCVVEVDGSDQNDDTCGLCGDGGDLICCDKCPSTFHLDCLELKSLPEGNWYCLHCSCGICGTVGQDGVKAMENRPLIFCDQCEQRYHEDCLFERNDQSGSSIGNKVSFCGQPCEKVFAGLHRLLGISQPLDGGFSWTLLKRFDDDQQAASSQELALIAECNAKLAVALVVMDECFVPIVDERTNIDMVSHVVYNYSSNFNRLNYQGFYTVVLERDDEVISVASIRIHGVHLAEMPLIGTRHHHRRQGMARRLVNAIEEMLLSLEVEKLILPAIADLLQTWTTAFGFKPLEDMHKKEIKNMNLMVFPGTDLLQKQIWKAEMKVDKQTAQGFCDNEMIEDLAAQPDCPLADRMNVTHEGG